MGLCQDSRTRDVAGNTTRDSPSAVYRGMPAILDATGQRERGGSLVIVAAFMSSSARCDRFGIGSLGDSLELQRGEQFAGVAEIRCVEAFGEPRVGIGEARVAHVGAALASPQSAEAGESAELQKLRV